MTQGPTMKNPANLEMLAMWLKEVQANPEALRSMTANAIKQEMAIALDLVESLGVPKTDTPSSQWYKNGQTDPHAGKYDGPRSELAYGNYTDDELANAVFMCDHRQSLSSIGFLTAAKERIRWLSRKLVKAQTVANKQPANPAFAKYRLWRWQHGNAIEELYTETGVSMDDVKAYIEKTHGYKMTNLLSSRVIKDKHNRIKPVIQFP